MPRYHITKAGNPGVCKAKHRCPLGDMEADHYDSKEEARSAFELKQENEDLLAAFKKSETLIVEEGANLREELDTYFVGGFGSFDDDEVAYSELFDEEPVSLSPLIRMISTPGSVDEAAFARLEEAYGDDLYVGRYSSWAGPAGERGGELMQEAAEEIVFEMSPGGEFAPPIDFYDEESLRYNTLEEPEEARYGSFLLLGSGASKNAYLHEPTGLVYKIPNAQSAAEWSDQEAKDQRGMVILDQKAYAGLDEEKLAQDGFEYAPTYFLQVKDGYDRPVPVVVQPYLSPEEYEPYSLTVEERAKLHRRYYLDDLKAANIRRRKSDGKIVLFDCLDYWGADGSAKVS